MILHIISQSDWEQAQSQNAYVPASLRHEGFIHFSLPDQVIATANRFYEGQTDLLLLLVDETKLRLELRYELPLEAPESDLRFPHLYGALNLDAVLRTVDFPPDAEGHWSALPAGINR
ncbi:MAG: DUF952 domain-containing protein [Chloroflexota bacterium]